MHSIVLVVNNNFFYKHGSNVIAQGAQNFKTPRFILGVFILLKQKDKANFYPQK
jgi:hypothetical protein